MAGTKGGEGEGARVIPFPGNVHPAQRTIDDVLADLRIAPAEEPIARRLAPAIARYLLDDYRDETTRLQAEIERLRAQRAADTDYALGEIYAAEARIDELRRMLVRQERRIAQLQIDSRTDVLTGAFNRRAYDEILAEEMARAERYGRPLSLLMLDIDHFKRINDTYGHLAGDGVLKRLVEIARAHVRKDVDKVARYGGEEFAIIMPEATGAVAHDHAERMRSDIQAKPVIYKDKRIPVTASFGVVTYDPHVMEKIDHQALSDMADEALYAAKHGGRNSVVLYPSRP